MRSPAGAVLPQHLFRCVLASSWLHRIPVLALTVTAFLLEVVPLELRRRIVNDAVKDGGAAALPRVAG